MKRDDPLPSAVYRVHKALLLPALGALLILLSTFSAELSEILGQRLLYCMEHLIPALFGGMLICNLAVCCGALQRSERFLCRRGLNGPLITSYIISQAAGYPAGVILLKDHVAEGILSRDQARRYACVCFGAGPSFIVGLAGAQLLGNAMAGWLLFLCCCGANLLVALMTLRGQWRCPARSAAVKADDGISALVKAAQLTMDGLWRIVGMVMLFGVVRFLAEKTGVVYLLTKTGEWLGHSAAGADACLGALLDVTALPEICGAGFPYQKMLPVMAAALSFGGLCVHCQNRAMGGGWFPVGRLLWMRGLTAALAAVLCALMLPLFPPREVADVFSAQPALSKSGSLLPSFLIFCTGFPLFLKKDWTK
ncbi:MAG: hypothetical protein E7503_04760 [Ruminococcus sp.]|nr:hypothetical protein [Ruminococcus sp.]